MLQSTVYKSLLHCNRCTQRFNSSELKSINKVGVVGLGLMGHGVAQMCAQAGFNVYAIEAQPAALDAGMER